MASPGDESVDELAVVHGWMQRLANDQPTAEEWTAETVRRYRQEQCPAWLQRRDALLALQYLTTRVVLERRGLI